MKYRCWQCKVPVEPGTNVFAYPGDEDNGQMYFCTAACFSIHSRMIDATVESRMKLILATAKASIEKT